MTADPKAILGSGERHSPSPVIPYARVVPNGTTPDGRLAATLLLTPDGCCEKGGCGGAGDSPLDLARWPAAILDYLAPPAGGGAADTGLTLHAIPLIPGLAGPIVPCAHGAPQPLAAAFAAPLGDIPAAERRDLTGLWQASLGGAEADWQTIARNIAAALAGQGTNAEVLGTKVEDLTQTGNEGQIKPTAPPGPEDGAKIVAMVGVRQADLALALEFQRVEELGLSLRECCGEPGARLNAETARRAELRSSTVIVSNGDEDPLGKARKVERSNLNNDLGLFNRRAAVQAFEAEKTRAATAECKPFEPNWAGLTPSTAINREEREKRFDEAASSHAYATWPEYPENTDDVAAGAPEEATHLAEALRNFFNLQSTPSLARAFGLAFDLALDPEALAGIAGESRFLLLCAPLPALFQTCFGTPAPRACVWTLCKLERFEDGWHFWPATEDEALACLQAGNTSDLPEGHLPSQVGGLLLMGAGSAADAAVHRPRFDLTSLDIRTAAELEMQRRTARAAAGAPGPEDTAQQIMQPDDLAHGASFHTAGITLLCRSAQVDAARRLARKILREEPMLGAATPGPRGAAICAGGEAGTRDVVLDASDLTVGYRLLVGLPSEDGGTDWRTVMGREITYGTTGDRRGPVVERVLARLGLGHGASARQVIDGAFLATPGRLLPTGASNPEANDELEVTVEEAIAVWNGGPMGVDCAAVPGKPVSVRDGLAFGRSLDLPSFRPGRDDARRFPPPLRHGWPYRFAMAAAFAGGHSVSPDALPDDREAQGPTRFLYYPPRALILASAPRALPFFRALRQTRLAAPNVLLPAGHATRTATGDGSLRDGAGRCGPMGYETGKRMVIRSALDTEGRPLRRRDENPRLAARATPVVAQRLIVPPGVPFDAAARHGAFDASTSRRPQGALPKIDFAEQAESFPVTATISVPGTDGVPHARSRGILRNPTADAGAASLGDGVFRARPSGGISRYYPDPAADGLAVAIRRQGESGYLRGGPIHLPLVSLEGSAGLTPVLLTIAPTSDPTRLRPENMSELLGECPAEGRRISFVPGRAGRIDRATSLEWSRGEAFWGRELCLLLAPGEAFEIDLWCVPSARRLAREFSLVQSLGIALAQSATPSICCTREAVLAAGAGLLPEPVLNDIARRLAAAPASPGTAFVGPGGVLAPPGEVLLAIAEALHARLVLQPLPEIAASTTIEAVHACNRPPRRPRLAENASQDRLEPVTALRPESEAGADTLGSYGFLLSGEVEIDLNACETLEVRALTVLPGSSAFDDPARGRSLARKRSGTWPVLRDLEGAALVDAAGRTRIVGAEALYGFRLGQDGTVEHGPSEVTLLRAENLPVTAGRSVSLLDLFKESLPGVRIAHRHRFPDGKARIMEVWVNALSRTAQAMTTVDRVASPDDPWRERDPIGSAGRPDLLRAEPLDPSDMENLSNRVRVILPATFRSAKCDARAPLPVFSWQCPPPNPRWTYARRRTALRLTLGRNWFSNGEGEMLGIVLWPPEPGSGTDIGNRITLPPGGPGAPQRKVTLNRLSRRDKRVVGAFADEDLGPGGVFVSRRGGDPVKGENETLGGGPETRLFLAQEDFPDLGRPKGDPARATFVSGVQMPLAAPRGVDGAAQPEPPLLVGLVLYEPRFDPVAEEWYVDVVLRQGPTAEPFVRLGLVRYQPHTLLELRCSEPVVQWAQPLPERRAVARRGSEPGRIVVTVSGRAPSARKGDRGNLGPLSAPMLRVTLFDEVEEASGHVRRRRLPLSGSDGKAAEASIRFRGGEARWTLAADLASLSFKGRAKVLLEEIDRFRPSTYDIEPVSIETATGPTYTESGPRFAALLDVTDLLGQMPSTDPEPEVLTDRKGPF